MFEVVDLKNHKPSQSNHSDNDDKLKSEQQMRDGIEKGNHLSIIEMFCSHVGTSVLTTAYACQMLESDVFEKNVVVAAIFICTLNHFVVILLIAKLQQHLSVHAMETHIATTEMTFFARSLALWCCYFQSFQ